MTTEFITESQVLFLPKKLSVFQHPRMMAFIFGFFDVTDGAGDAPDDARFAHVCDGLVVGAIAGCGEQFMGPAVAGSAGEGLHVVFHDAEPLIRG